MSDDPVASMIANLAERTGRDLAGWLALLAGEAPAKHGQIVAYLKATHGLTHGYANLIAHQHLAGGAPVPGDDLVAAQYAGAKQALRPVYDRIVGQVSRFGGDVEVAPKKTYVSLRRAKQFGVVKPSTRTRVDVGLVLPVDAEVPGATPVSGMWTHQVAVHAPEDVDEALVGLLRRAYELAGPRA